jgi:hypothetical protein
LLGLNRQRWVAAGRPFCDGEVLAFQGFCDVSNHNGLAWAAWPSPLGL